MLDSKSDSSLFRKMLPPAAASDMNMDASMLFAEDNTNLMLQSMLRGQFKPSSLHPPHWTEANTLATAPNMGHGNAHRSSKLRAGDAEPAKGQNSSKQGHGPHQQQQEHAARKEEGKEDKKRRSRVNPLKEMQDLFQV